MIGRMSVRRTPGRLSRWDVRCPQCGPVVLRLITHEVALTMAARHYLSHVRFRA